MALAAQQVVDTMVTRLVGATAAGARVYADHPHPFDRSELPAWRVELEEEPAEAVMLSSDVHQHTGRLRICGYVLADESLDGELNALAAAAMPALFAAPLPYGLEIAGEIERRLLKEGQADVGEIVIPLRALYFVAASAPETILSA